MRLLAALFFPFVVMGQYVATVPATTPAAGGGPAVVQSAQCFQTGTHGSCAATFASATTSGHYIAVFEGQSTSSTNNSTPTDTASQTYTHLADACPASNGVCPGGSSEWSYYYFENSASVTTVTCNFTNSTNVTCIVLDISGVKTSSSLDADVIQGTGGSSSTTSTSGSLTTTNSANDLLIFGSRVGANNSGNFTAGTGYAFPADGNGTNTRGAVQTKNVTGVQTGITTTTTYTAQGTNANIFVAIKGT